MLILRCLEAHFFTLVSGYLATYVAWISEAIQPRYLSSCSRISSIISTLTLDICPPREYLIKTLYLSDPTGACPHLAILQGSGICHVHLDHAN